MSCPLELARPMAYGLIGAGCLLALATALAPQLTGAYHLEAGYLICGLIPYIVYGSLTELLGACTLLVSGTALLVADGVARFGFAITAAGQGGEVGPAIWLCTLLVLLVLPAGAGVGRVLDGTCS